MLKYIIKALFSFTIYYGCVFFLIKSINNILGRRLTILTYHRVTDSDISSIETSLPYLFVTKFTFEKQLKFIKKHYKIINFVELNNYLIKKKGIPRNSLIITFDDGYEDNYQHALEIHKKLNIPAVIFLTVNKVSDNNHTLYWWDHVYYLLFSYKQWYVEGLYPELDKKILSLIDKFTRSPSGLFSYLNKRDSNEINELLDSIETKYSTSANTIYDDNKIVQWGQILRMSEYFELGSHSCNHSNIIKLNSKRMNYEIEESLKIIENKTGNQVIAFSYPYGNYNEVIKNTVANAGYKFAVTTEEGTNSLKDKYALRRINIWEGTCRTFSGKFSKTLFACKLLGIS